jgi:small subunit ribosomal protein S5e
LVDVVVNAEPYEDSIRIESQATVRRQAVCISPLRRINQTISLITINAREVFFRNIKTIAGCLAEEVINPAKDNVTSYTIKK